MAYLSSLQLSSSADHALLQSLPEGRTQRGIGEPLWRLISGREIAALCTERVRIPWPALAAKTDDDVASNAVQVLAL